MPDRSSSKQSASLRPMFAFSGAPGCFILSMGGLLVVGAVIWGCHTFTQQAREVSAFTSPTADPPGVKATTAAELEALREKLATFARAVDAGQAPTLSLSAEELNTMLAGFPEFESLRTMVSVRTITSERISAQVSLPMNVLPGQRAFLNGVIHFKPAIHREAGPYLAVETIEVPGKKVPDGFIEVYRRGVLPGKSFGFFDDMLLGNFRSDPIVGKYLGKINKVTVSNGTVIATATGVNPAQ